MQTPEQMDADVEAFSKQYDAEQVAKTQQEQQAQQPPSFLQRWTQPVVHATLSTIDSAVSEAERMYAASNNDEDGMMRQGRNIAAGVSQGVADAGDSVDSLAHSVARNVQGLAADPRQAAIEQSIGSESDAAARRMQWMDQQGAPTSPIWDHAKNAILDFRDAVAVKDPTMADNLVQSVAQLAVPFAGYSRALAGLHGLANVVGGGLLTDTTVLQPHDMRTADLIALGQHTEGKLGEVLRAMGPYGLNWYVNFLTDRTDESEAGGRFKNALDGLGANLILTPILHAVGVTLKQGMPALRYLAENAGGGPIPGGMKAQAGKIVFHGTPHDFDEFDTSKIGTGEGNQVYGHGLYFAENPKTGGFYRDALERRNIPAGSPMDTATTAIRQAGSARDAFTSLTDQAAKARDPEWRDNLLKAAELVKSGNAAPKGKLLHVDIPDEHLDAMLDYDKPLSQQPQVLEKLAASDEKFEAPAGATGAELLKQLGGGAEASMRLQQAGIPGIRYLDGASRGSGEGTRNVVLFDAKHAKIVRKE